MITIEMTCSNNLWLKWLGDHENLCRYHLEVTPTAPRLGTLRIWMKESKLPELIKVANLTPMSPALPIAQRMFFASTVLLGRGVPLEPTRVEPPEYYSPEVCALDTTVLEKP